MVTRQMACGGAQAEDRLWLEIERDITRATNRAVDVAEQRGVDLRTAHLINSGFIDAPFATGP
jgi:hypothetical protein